MSNQRNDHSKNDQDHKKIQALEYHSEGRPGKIEVISTKPTMTSLDLTKAYSPGVAWPCLEIAKDPELAYKYTAKGNLLEDLAIEMSGKMRFRNYQKHVGRVENELITGECDVLDLERKLIIDTKVTWDIGTHPFFQDEAMEKVKKAGYDVQMQAYMWLYDCEVAHVDFWLFPCPPELLKDWDDIDQLVHLVEAIDIRERKTTVTIERDESVIQKIKDKIPHCQNYYEQLFAERSKGKVAA